MDPEAALTALFSTGGLRHEATNKGEVMIHVTQEVGEALFQALKNIRQKLNEGGPSDAVNAGRAIEAAYRLADDAIKATPYTQGISDG